jgi:hypothetical protein
MYADDLLQPWADCALADVGGPVVDAHTHVGDRDPSGFSATLPELTESLGRIDGRAVVFPLADPDGYAQGNLACARAAADSEGRLFAFARLTPDDDPGGRLEAALQAGARGIKLHPAGDSFRLDDERLRPAYEAADERRLPVLLHAGPELEGVGETALTLCRRHPGLRVILAHCALTDLGWIWRHVDETPNLFFDTSWWGPVHLLALLRLVPPGRVLNASDLPYCTPLSGLLGCVRSAVQAGLDAEQVASVAGGQMTRLLDGEDPLDLGGPPAQERRPVSPLLEVLGVTLLCALEGMQRGGPPGSQLAVARHACKVPEDDPDAEVVASVARLIALYDEQHDRLDKRNQFAPGWDLLQAAAFVARTPAAPVP